MALSPDIRCDDNGSPGEIRHKSALHSRLPASFLRMKKPYHQSFEYFGGTANFGKIFTFRPLLTKGLVLSVDRSSCFFLSHRKVPCQRELLLIIQSHNCRFTTGLTRAADADMRFSEAAASLTSPCSIAPRSSVPLSACKTCPQTPHPPQL